MASVIDRSLMIMRQRIASLRECFRLEFDFGLDSVDSYAKLSIILSKYRRLTSEKGQTASLILLPLLRETDL